MKIYLNSEHVRLLIAKKNKDLAWFARRLQVSRGYVSVLLAQKKSPRPQVRDKIQKILNGHKWDDLFVMNSTTTMDIKEKL